MFEKVGRIKSVEIYKEKSQNALLDNQIQQFLFEDMEKGNDEEFHLNENIIGVHRILPNGWLQANDGGAAEISVVSTKHTYNHQYGYYIPGGYHFTIRAFSGGHQITLGNFELKKGYTYTLSAYFRTKQNLQLINPAIKGQVQIFCKKLINNYNEVSSTSQLALSTSEYLPNFKKFVSKPYTPEEDEIIAININPYLQNYSEFTFDILHPEIQWRK